MTWAGIDRICDNYALFLAWQWRLLGYDYEAQLMLGTR